MPLLFAAGRFAGQALAGRRRTTGSRLEVAWRCLTMDGSGWYGAFVLREFAGEALVLWAGSMMGLLKPGQLVSAGFEKIW